MHRNLGVRSPLGGILNSDELYLSFTKFIVSTTSHGSSLMHSNFLIFTLSSKFSPLHDPIRPSMCALPFSKSSTLSRDSHSSCDVFITSITAANLPPSGRQSRSRRIPPSSILTSLHTPVSFPSSNSLSPTHNQLKPVMIHLPLPLHSPYCSSFEALHAGAPRPTQVNPRTALFYL